MAEPSLAIWMLDSLRNARMESASLRARVAELERQRDESEIAFKAAHAEMDEAEALLKSAEFKLGCADAYGALQTSRLDAALAQVQAMREALRGLADEIMWDKTLCFCGPNHGPAPHGKDCLDARAALALATPDAPHP